jgi:hypothetical protein
VAGREEVGGEARGGGNGREERRGGGAGAGERGQCRRGEAPQGHEGQHRAEAGEQDVRVEEGAEGPGGTGDEEGGAGRRPRAEDPQGRPPAPVETRPVTPGQAAQDRGEAEAEHGVETDVGEVQEARVGARRQVEAVEAERDERAHHDRSASVHPPSAEPVPRDTPAHGGK